MPEILEDKARTPVPALDAVPEPWDYNPSAWPQRVRVSLVAAVGFLVAAYMGLYQLGLIRDVWDPVFGDQTLKVLDSDASHRMSRWMRVGDSLFGSLAYLGDIVFAMAGSTRRWQYRPWLVVLFGIDVIPLGIVSVILVITQGFVVQAWCFLCLVSAAISLGLIFLAYDEVWSSLKFLRRVWVRSGGDLGVWWRVLWGKPHDAAVRAGEDIVKWREH